MNETAASADPMNEEIRQVTMILSRPEPGTYRIRGVCTGYDDVTARFNSADIAGLCSVIGPALAGNEPVNVEMVFHKIKIEEQVRLRVDGIWTHNEPVIQRFVAAELIQIAAIFEGKI